MKPNAKKKKWTTLLVFEIVYLIVFLTSIALIPICTRQPGWVKQMLAKENPHEFTEQRNIFSDISEIEIESDCLYVLYGDYGVIEIYTPLGEYQRSYAFYSQGSGRARTYQNEEGVWLEGKDHTLYLFHGGRFVKKLSGREVLEETKLYDLRSELVSEDGNTYHYRIPAISNAIIRETPEGEKEVILRRPFIDFFAQQIPLFFLPVLLFTPPFIIFAYKSNRRRKEEKEENTVSWRKELEYSNWKRHSD